ncbi:cobalt-zinc-cadmium efflux system protein [Rhodovulum imhoffii]|uniref:Cobalt-zinc-cadmium efflux system protein n=1 Tax=Rhodovulum imhoffii TaxID=365340 RepID=A0A2T5BS33_9RHOB|nr:cation diffusion facilitator family transporter [Rhodovulum imhoffii]MBK5934699.1 cation transporter [Rhodovulum imhoffii]PTN02122.1 cobalt-zinc-cadmium efflux system protein [Rhodovulum imhoffii]
MGAHHHHHHHIDPEAGDRRVAWAVGVNMLLTVAQIVGGIVSGSLALVADAIHNFSDAISLIVALVARRIARRPSDARMTFGYHRAEIVAAMVNYTTLIVIALYLIYEAVLRLVDPPGVTGWIVVVVAAIALVVDVITALLTYAMSKSSVNIRAAFLHNVADALGSVAVIVAGTLILIYDWRLIDPLVTLGIAVYILWHVAQDIGPVIRMLMMGGPDAPGLGDVRARLMAEDGVEDLHHLHLWQIDEHRTAFEAHVVMAEDAGFAALTARLKRVLLQEFGIAHATLEVETVASGCADPR